MKNSSSRAIIWTMAVEAKSGRSGASEARFEPPAVCRNQIQVGVVEACSAQAKESHPPSGTLAAVTARTAMRPGPVPIRFTKNARPLEAQP